MYRTQLLLRSTFCCQRLCALQQNLRVSISREQWCGAIKTGLSGFSTVRTLSNAAGRQAGGAPSSDGKRKKTKEVSKITLIGQNQALSVTTLEEAQKLAKRRDLHLLRVDELDTKTGRAVFKLATTAEMLAQELEDGRSFANEEKTKSTEKRSEKSLTIGTRITEHDLASRLKNISKWLAKRHEVRILIQGTADDVNCERIFKTIEQFIKEPQVIGKVVQKRNKGNVTRFNIVPVSTPTQS